MMMLSPSRKNLIPIRSRCSLDVSPQCQTQSSPRGAASPLRAAADTLRPGFAGSSSTTTAAGSPLKHATSQTFSGPKTRPRPCIAPTMQDSRPRPRCTSSSTPLSAMLSWLHPSSALHEHDSTPASQQQQQSALSCHEATALHTSHIPERQRCVVADAERLVRSLQGKGGCSTLQHRGDTVTEGLPLDSSGPDVGAHRDVANRAPFWSWAESLAAAAAAAAAVCGGLSDLGMPKPAAIDAGLEALETERALMAIIDLVATAAMADLQVDGQSLGADESQACVHALIEAGLLPCLAAIISGGPEAACTGGEEGKPGSSLLPRLAAQQVELLSWLRLRGLALEALCGLLVPPGVASVDEQLAAEIAPALVGALSDYILHLEGRRAAEEEDRVEAAGQSSRLARRCGQLDLAAASCGGIGAKGGPRRGSTNHAGSFKKISAEISADRHQGQTVQVSQQQQQQHNPRQLVDGVEQSAHWADFGDTASAPAWLMDQQGPQSASDDLGMAAFALSGSLNVAAGSMHGPRSRSSSMEGSRGVSEQDSPGAGSRSKSSSKDAAHSFAREAEENEQGGRGGMEREQESCSLQSVQLRWDELGLATVSCVVRMSKVPLASRSLVEARVVPLLARLLRHGNMDVGQVTLLALYKLSMPSSAACSTSTGVNGSQAASDVSATRNASKILQQQQLQQQQQQREVVLKQLLFSGSVPQLCDALVEMSDMSCHGDGDALPALCQQGSKTVWTEPLVSDCPTLAATATPDGSPAAVASTSPSSMEEESLTTSSTTSSVLRACIPDIVGALLLDMSVQPGLPQVFADQDLVRHVVELLRCKDPQVCLVGLAVLGRLASSSVACQMDIVREGALPHLVAMLTSSVQPQHQLHAARLLSILAQSVPTHGRMSSEGALAALVAAVRTPQPRIKEHAWKGREEEAREGSNEGAKEGDWVWSGSQLQGLGSSQLGQLQGLGTSQLGQLQGLGTSQLGQQGWAESPATDIPEVQSHAGRRDVMVSHELNGAPEEESISGEQEVQRMQVVRHAASALAVLAQNPELHFDLVGIGAVPAMVQLIGQESQAALSHALAFLMLIATQDARHAAVVARAGAIPTVLQQLSQQPGQEHHGQMHHGATQHHRSRHSQHVHARTSGVSNISASDASAFELGADASATGAHMFQSGSNIAVGDASLSAMEGAEPGFGSCDDGPAVAGRALDFAVALLATLCNHQDIQAELVEAGGLPVLLHLMADLPPDGEGASLAAEALALIAAGAVQHRLALAVRAPELVAACQRLLAGPDTTAHYWSLTLLNQLTSEQVVLEEALHQGLQRHLAALLKPLHPQSSPVASVWQQPGHGDSEWSMHHDTWRGPLVDLNRDVGMAEALSTSEPMGSQGCLVEGSERLGDGNGVKEGPALPAERSLDGGGTEAAAWGAHQALDASLARVQAAWLTAHMARLGFEAAAAVSAAGVVPSLVRLLAEAVGASGRAACKAREAESVSGDQQQGVQWCSVDSHWFEDQEERMRAELARLQRQEPAGAAAVASLNLLSPPGAGGPAATSKPVGLESNACAAATAAILALAGQGGAPKLAVSQELSLQVWLGQTLYLPGLPGFDIN